MAGVASTRLAAVAADETAAPQAAAPGFRSLSSNLRRITPGQRRDGAIRLYSWATGEYSYTQIAEYLNCACQA